MKIIIYIIITLSILSLVCAWETQFIEFQNETISITPVINICENTSNVFRIERENYTSESSLITINYIQKTITENETSTNITKTINKYSTTNTGKYNISKNSNANITFENENQKLIWNFTINCFNITMNNTELNDTNLTTEVNITTNETNNKTNQNTTNITPDQNNYSKEENNSNQKNCYEKFEIKTNKDIYNPGEKIEMNFLADYWPINYEINYKIEYLDGTDAKKEYTTTNNKTKTYTTKSSEQEEKTHQIIAEIKSDCGNLEAKKIVVVKNEIEKEEKESKLKLTETIKDKVLEVSIYANRGDNLKSVIEIYLEDSKGKTISEKTKLSLLNKESEIEITTYFSIPEEEKYYLIGEGLGFYEIKEIENNNYEEKQEKIMMTKEEKTVKKEEKEIIEPNITVQKSSKEITPVSEEKNDKISNSLFTIVLGLTAGIATSIYFKKPSAQRHL